MSITLKNGILNQETTKAIIQLRSILSKGKCPIPIWRLARFSIWYDTQFCALSQSISSIRTKYLVTDENGKPKTTTIPGGPEVYEIRDRAKFEEEISKLLDLEVTAPEDILQIPVKEIDPDCQCQELSELYYQLHWLFTE